MGVRALLTVACAVAAGAVPPVAAGAQAPGQDSANMTGGPGQANLFGVFTLNAASGTTGGNPTGRVDFVVDGFVNLSGPVTCLAVHGTTATINFYDQRNGFGVVTVQVGDDQPDTFDANAVGRRSPSDCSPLPFSFLGGPLSGADITIVDAPPLPWSNDKCQHGGWQDFGIFKNQGQCVSYVATGTRKHP